MLDPNFPIATGKIQTKDSAVATAELYKYPSWRYIFKDLAKVVTNCDHFTYPQTFIFQLDDIDF